MASPRPERTARKPSENVGARRQDLCEVGRRQAAIIPRPAPHDNRRRENGVVTATALVVGLGALAYAYARITAADLPDHWYPEGVHDRAAFARAGTMHNFSDLGGFLGIITASLYLAVERFRLTRSIHPQAGRHT